MRAFELNIEIDQDDIMAYHIEEAFEIAMQQTCKKEHFFAALEAILSGKYAYDIVVTSGSNHVAITDLDLLKRVAIIHNPLF